MKGFINIIIVAGCLLATGDRAAAGEKSWMERFALSGWVEAVQSIQTRHPHGSLTSRAWLRTELSADFGSAYGFLSVDAEKNWKISDETGIHLHEIWLEYVADGWDARIGRQVIIWGNADGVQITDIISPPDYTEYITRDLDEIRMPVDAARFRLLGEYIDTEFIWIPVFQAAILPTGDNPWAVHPDYPEGVQTSVASVDEPSISLGNSEIALKVSGFFSGLDAAASVFYTWDDYPIMYRGIQMDVDTTHLTFSPKNHRLLVLGLEFSRPWGDFVFRSESAYYKGRYYETRDILENSIKKDAIHWLVGTDWTPGDDWRVTAQLTGVTIFDYEPCMVNSHHSPMITLNVSKKLWRQTTTLSNMLYYGLVGKGFFLTASKPNMRSRTVFS